MKLPDKEQNNCNSCFRVAFYSIILCCDTATRKITYLPDSSHLKLFGCHFHSLWRTCFSTRSPFLPRSCLELPVSDQYHELRVNEFRLQLEPGH